MNINDLRARVTAKPITRKQKITAASAATGAVIGGTIGFGVAKADKKYGILGGRTVKRSKRVAWYGDRINALLAQADKCEGYEEAAQLRAEAKELSERSLELQTKLIAKKGNQPAAEVKAEELLDGCCPRDPEAVEETPSVLEVPVTTTEPKRDEAWVKETSEAIVAAGQHHNNKVLLGLSVVDIDTIIDVYPEFATEWMGDTWKGWTPTYRRHCPPIILVPGVDQGIANDPNLQYAENGLVYDTIHEYKPIGFEKSMGSRTNAIRKTLLIQRLNDWYTAKAAGEFSAQAHAELDKQSTPAVPTPLTA